MNLPEKVVMPNWMKNILIVLFVILSFFFFNQYNAAKADLIVKEKMIEAAESKTVFYKDELGRQVAKSNVVESMKIEDFTKAVFNNPAMIELQKLAKENSKKISHGGSVTYIQSGGEIDREGDTHVTIDAEQNPVYTDTFKDKWIEYDIQATRTKVGLHLKYNDEYSIVIGSEKDSTAGFFKKLFLKPKPVAWVTTASPYSKIKESKTYQITDTENSRLSVGAMAGYGVNLANLKPAPYVGLGVSYRLFSLGKKIPKK